MFKIVKNLYLPPAAVTSSPIMICWIWKLQPQYIAAAPPMDKAKPT